MKTISVIVIAVGLLTGCTTTSKSAKPSGILCVATTYNGAEFIDCLNPKNAAKEDVDWRVALYNKDKIESKQIGCKRRKSVGSNFSRWQCYGNNSATEDTNTANEFNDIIRTGAY